MPARYGFIETHLLFSQYGGQSHIGAASPQYAGDQVQRYGPRSSGSQVSTREWISLPPTRSFFARPPRYCPEALSHAYFCAWMLLASAWLRPKHSSEIARKLLAPEAHEKFSPVRRATKAIARARLASDHDMGVSDSEQNPEAAARLPPKKKGCSPRSPLVAAASRLVRLSIAL
jgi:hypothetical protein